MLDVVIRLPAASTYTGRCDSVLTLCVPVALTLYEFVDKTGTRMFGARSGERPRWMGVSGQSGSGPLVGFQSTAVGLQSSTQAADATGAEYSYSCP